MVPCISLYSEKVFACSCSGNGYGFPVPDYGKTVRVRKSCFGKYDSGGTAIPVALNIQFRISANDMNIIRKAGSCRLCLPEYGPCPVPADEDNLYRFHTHPSMPCEAVMEQRESVAKEP